MQQYKHGDIILAAKKGAVSDLKQCLAAGANIEEQDSNGNTALTWAAGSGHNQAVAFLITSKANLNHTNKFGRFPLLNAKYFGHDDVCELLINSGADKNKKYEGQTAETQNCG